MIGPGVAPFGDDPLSVLTVEEEEEAGLGVGVGVGVEPPEEAELVIPNPAAPGDVAPVRRESPVAATPEGVGLEAAAGCGVTGAGGFCLGGFCPGGVR